MVFGDQRSRQKIKVKRPEKANKTGTTRGIKTVPQYTFFKLVCYSHC